MKRSWQESSLWILLRTTLEEWNADNAARLSASLAYYTIFSIAPLLVLVVAMGGAFYGREAAQGQLAQVIDTYIGNEDAAELIQTAVKNARVPETNVVATVVSVALLLWGASGVFGELRGALNNIWDVPPRANGGVRDFVVNRVLMLVMVMVGGLLLLISVVASAALATATTWANGRLPGLENWSPGINFLFFFVVTLVVFVLIYKFVPEVHVSWRDVWAGAVATALLFSVGRLLIAWYLGRTTIASAYGAAGSLALLLLYTYYSAQVFFLGAEFTQVYGRTYGSRRQEHILIEEPIPAEPQQTVEVADGTIVPAAAAAQGAANEPAGDAPPLSAPPLSAPPLSEPLAAQASTGPAPVAGEPRPRLERLRRLARPVGEVGAALGVIALLSVVNLVAAPLRRSSAGASRSATTKTGA